MQHTSGPTKRKWTINGYRQYAGETPLQVDDVDGSCLRQVIYLAGNLAA
jgi:hypothetical protein